MLNIYLGDMDAAIYHPPTYFDNTYEDEWLLEPLTKKMIEDVDSFAAAVRESDNYFVLITRENLYNLPYSVEEIYGIHSSGKYQNTKRVYQQMYRIYSEVEQFPIEPKCIVVSEKSIKSGVFT